MLLQKVTLIPPYTHYIHCTTTYFNTRDLKPDGLNGRTAESHSTADLDLLYVADILRKELDVLMAGRQGEGRGREEVRLIIGRELYSVHRSVTLKIIIKTMKKQLCTIANCLNMVLCVLKPIINVNQCGIIFSSTKRMLTITSITFYLSSEV